jgi:hypothetical protein
MIKFILPKIYIDLSDKTLNRKGIKQIYKDQDNEELRYSIRSIFQYIPWIHKIYIIMPNIKVKFLKSIGKLQDKIVYINDKQLIGYDSANIFSFTFNLFKLKNFGVSNNFIYMEDDFFIGKPLKKSDFFYYDKKTKKVVPFILTKYFSEINKTEILALTISIKGKYSRNNRCNSKISLYFRFRKFTKI